MTRTKALLKLLEHGALTRTEIAEIMGGSRAAAFQAIDSLHKRRKIKLVYLPHAGECYSLNGGL